MHYANIYMIHRRVGLEKKANQAMQPYNTQAPYVPRIPSDITYTHDENYFVHNSSTTVTVAVYDNSYVIRETPV